MDFDKFIKDLVIHEKDKIKKELKNKKDGEVSRELMIICGGIRLNWIGDYVGNPDMKWQSKELPLDKIQFSGADHFLTKVCKKSPLIFWEAVKNNSRLKAKYQKIASFGNEPILVRNGSKKGKYKVLDGMHRLIGSVLNGKKKIMAYIPLNEKEVLPYCEAHVIYDLIRGYLRNAHDQAGEKELYYGLKLLLRAYGNTEKLLRGRFNRYWVDDNKVQKIIQKVLTEHSNFNE